MQEVDQFLILQTKCLFSFKARTTHVCDTLTLATVIQSAPSPSPDLWRHPFGIHAHTAPTQSGILGCASANLEESHRPACAVTR